MKALGFALLVALFLPLALQAEADRVSLKPGLKKEVFGIVQRLQKDPAYLALKGNLKGKMLNKAVVDAYLHYLPISPLEIYNFDRWTHRWLMPVPDFIEVYHERWKQLHPAEARRFYGPEKPRRSEGYSYVEEAILGEGTEKKTEVGTNLNLVHDNAQPPTSWQSEVQIVANPNNPRQMVAASNTFKFPWICGPRTLQTIFYSSDGGATWGFTCAPNPLQYGLDCDARGGILNGSDPALAWNNNNEVFFNHMAICNDGTPRTAMVIARSIDGGATWTAQGVIKDSWSTTDFEDKNFLAIDTNATSPYYGRLYSCWARNSDEKVAFSSNNGATWTERDIPAPPQGGSDLACDIAVQKNGTVHIAWDTLLCNAVECTHEWIYYTRSTDGGNTWSTPRLVADLNFAAFSNDSCPDAAGDRCVISMGSIDVDNSGGPCNNTLYVTYGDKPGNGKVNNMDVFVRRSTDGGNTWSSAVRVNDDPAGGKIQFFPFLTVDQVKGNPVVAWYDGRNDPANTEVDIFATRSVNCGLSFKKNVQVTKPSTEFNNSTISYSDESANNAGHNVNQYGDYLGLDARNAKAYVAWTDSRHFFPAFTTDPQKENIAFATVTFGPPAPENPNCDSSSYRNTLTWTDNPKATDLVGYNVYRVSDGVYTRIGYVNVSGYSSAATRYYYDSAPSLTAAKSRSYAVAGVDSQGDEGPYSAVFADQ